MNEANRRILAAVFGATLLVTGATAFVAHRTAAKNILEQNPSSSVRWDSPEGEAHALRILAVREIGRMPHGHDDGLAMSHSGQVIALAVAGDPVNHIDVIGLSGSSRTTLAHRNRRLALLDPVLDRAGTRIAFVVAAPSVTGEYTGLSELWISATSGSNLLKVNSAGEYVRMPTFSPDGTRIAYFREVSAPHLPGDEIVAPENMQVRPMALFEYDFSSSRERRLTHQAYRGAGRIAYTMDGRQLYFAAGDELQPSIRDSDGATLWVPSSSSYADIVSGAQEVGMETYRLTLPEGWDDPTSEPVSDEHQLEGELLGLDVNGAPVYLDHDYDNGGLLRMFVRTAGGSLGIGSNTYLAISDQTVSHAAIAPNGARAVAVVAGRTRVPGGLRGAELLVGEPGRQPRRFELAETPTQILTLTPPGQTRFPH